MATRRKAASVPRKKKAASAAKLNARDFEAIRLLLSHYCMLIDKGDLKGLAALYHRNAVFSVSFDPVKSHTGRDTILAWYTRFFFDPPRKVGFPRHKLFEPCIIEQDGRVTATSYFDSDFVEADGKVRILAGRYDDVLVKERGRWYFKERSILIHHHYSPGTAQRGMAS